MKTQLLCSAFTFLAALPAQEPTTPSSMPVRELTAFKDGHAYVLRDTELQKSADGTVVLDELPTPVLGTFWPFVSGGDARLVSARSGRDEVTVERPAVSVLELAAANVGKVVTLELADGADVSGRLRAMPKHDGGGSILLVEVGGGVRAIATTRVRGISVAGECAVTIEQQRQQARIVLDVEGGGDGARVGVVYVEKGFRWIPSYRVDLGDDGRAKVQLQATLVNDLVDLDGATVNLVVGVPKFAFADMVDPIALQQRTSQVAHAARQQQQFSNFLGNSLTTQVAGYAVPQGGQPAAQPGPDVGAGEAAEDLFVFPVTGVRLKKGERLIVPVTSFELPYEDAYRLDVPMAPPMEYQRGLNDQRVIELARQLAAPKVVHLLRFDNTGPGPLTTAPALVFAKGRILAQGHMKYTPRGAKADLEINTAIDVCIETEEHETGREDNVRMRDARYSKIDLTGTIELHNAKSEPVEVEVTRRVLGHVDEVDRDGQKVQLDLVGAWADSPRPQWWGWWSWPWWWYHHNGFGECRWTVKLEANQRVALTARWHYYWR
jgi:hypothetical protein